MGPFFSKVAIMDPQEIEDILTRRLDDFAFSNTQKAVFGGAMPTGMLSIPTDHMWSTHRKRLAPWFVLREAILAPSHAMTQYEYPIPKAMHVKNQ